MLAIAGGALATVTAAVTVLPASFPSCVVTVQATSSPPPTHLSRTGPELAFLPLTVHSAQDLSSSPSGSAKPDQVQRISSPAFGVAGVMEAAATVGSVFLTVTSAWTGRPSAFPSDGVAVQTTRSPPRNETLGVAPSPAGSPLTVQAMRVATSSPSASCSPEVVHCSALPDRTTSGEIWALARRGALLSTVRDPETGAPSSLPSEGVMVQTTLSAPFSGTVGDAPFPASLPLTVHATRELSLSPSASLNPS